MRIAPGGAVSPLAAGREKIDVLICGKRRCLAGFDRRRQGFVSKTSAFHQVSAQWRRLKFAAQGGAYFQPKPPRMET
jgi:hypothetical protein